MRTLRRLVRRLSSWATTQQDEERLRAEIEEHLALQAADNVRAGLSLIEARRQSVLKFGGVEAMKEGYRDQRGLPFLETLIQDTRHALRRLRMAPAFTTATILTLALGIGATTSIFTLVHAVMLKSLPVANPGELYRLGRESHCCYLGGYSQDKEFSLVSYDLYKYFRDNTKWRSRLPCLLFSMSGCLTRRDALAPSAMLNDVWRRRSMPRTSMSYRPGQLSLLYRRIHDSIANIPGVSSVALCLYSPQGGGAWGAAVWVDGQPAPGPRDDHFAAWDRVTAGYFDVIGTPIVEGRGISEQDTAASRRVAVVNEAFARKFFRNEDPIGKHFGRKPAESREFEVVGVAKDARYLTFNLDRPIGPFFFLPEAQAEYTQTNLGSLFLHDIVILTRPGANLPIAGVRQAMASVDPGMPVISIRTLREQVANQFTQQRLIARLTSFFGVLSLALASIGLYGVTAYNAGSRVSEIGVRMALGANRGHVVALVLRGAVGLILLGLLVGLPLTFAAGRFLGSQLYGMNPYNPVVTLAAVVTLGLSALAASLIPALRASLISPLEALRVE